MKYTQKIDRLQDNCPVRAALDVVRGRWKPAILFELRTRARRFSELQAALPGITAQTLSKLTTSFPALFTQKFPPV